jgi:hypothetical protein
MLLKPAFSSILSPTRPFHWTGRIKSGKIKSGNYFRAMTQLPRPLRFAVILPFALLSGCSHLVKISYAPEAVIHPAFDQPTMNWDGERVQVVLAPSLQGEPLKYLASP